MIGTEPKAWRPQRFGRRAARDIHDPLVEPLWEGERVLAHVTPESAELFDTDGATITDDVREIAEQLRGAVLAESLVLDGYLTIQATQPPGALLIGDSTLSAGELAGQMFLGSAGRRALKPPPEVPLAPEAPLAFIAVDLLLLDGEPLLDIPLLERKRLLDSVLVERDIVRVGIYVRPPLDTWLLSWRSVGFRSIAFKAANSRYEPGRPAEDWAETPIPTR